MANTTREQHWFNLFDHTATRREFLRVSQGVVGLVALGSLPGCGKSSGSARRDGDEFRGGKWPTRGPAGVISPLVR